MANYPLDATTGAAEMIPHVIVMWNQGAPEMWLGRIENGIWAPVGNTGPLRPPDDWRRELIDAKHKADDEKWTSST